MEDNRAWYAVSVRARHEKTVANNLNAKGFQCFLPCYEIRREWSDRMKRSQKPLFTGYVFCRALDSERLSVSTTPAVRGIVGFGNRPAPVPDEEINALRSMAVSGLPLATERRLHTGEPVTIVQGPLCGLRGCLKRIDGGLRMVVNVELLHHSVSVTVHRNWVMPVSRQYPVPARQCSCLGRPDRIAMPYECD